MAVSTWCVTYVSRSPSRWGGRLVAVKAGFTNTTAAAPAFAYMACDAAEALCHIDAMRDDEPAEPEIESRERMEMDMTRVKETTSGARPQTNYPNSGLIRPFSGRRE